MNTNLVKLCKIATAPEFYRTKIDQPRTIPKREEKKGKEKEKKVSIQPFCLERNLLCHSITSIRKHSFQSVSSVSYFYQQTATWLKGRNIVNSFHNIALSTDQSRCNTIAT